MQTQVGRFGEKQRFINKQTEEGGGLAEAAWAGVAEGFRAEQTVQTGGWCRV